MNGRIEIGNRSFGIDALTALAVIVGIVVGVIVSFSVEREQLISLCSFEGARSQGWFRVFLSSFLNCEIWLVVAFLFGFGAVYQPLSILLLAFRGLGLGACTRGIYLTADVVYNLSVFLPLSLVSLALLILQTKQAYSLQTMYLSLTMTNENRIGLKREASDYVARFLIYTAILAVATVIEFFIISLISA